MCIKNSWMKNPDWDMILWHFTAWANFALSGCVISVLRKELLYLSWVLCSDDVFDILIKQMCLSFFQDNRVHIGPKMEIRVVTLGLDGAGKTTILFKLKQDEFMQPIPTIGILEQRKYTYRNANMQRCLDNKGFYFCFRF